ncbi:MAG: hypothetical protein AAGE94_16205, partial [Acidobacteriota bacterium]
MVERLRQIAEGPDAIRNPFNNDRLVERLRRAPRPRTVEARVEADLDLALQLLRAGASKEAATRFEALLENVELLQDTGLLDESQLLDEPTRRSARSATGEQRRREIRRLIALSHLRIAEQENCLLHHQSQSCLVPIRAGGLHHRPEASRRAMELYGELLVEDPGDQASRWLYNLAAMTLGLYPDEVPEDWRIDPSVFASEADVPTAVDVAPQTGADVSGLAGGVVFDDLDG